MSQGVETLATECVSCRRPLSGRYCAHCGEKVLDPESLTVRHFVTHTVLQELGNVDGKLWRTLRSLMTRPGFLSSEYASGRRKLYVNPVRLLLLSIIFYALVTQGGFLVTFMLGRVTLSLAPTAVRQTVSVADTVTRIDRFGILQRMLAAKAQSVDLGSDTVRERFHRRLNQFAQPLSFANVVLLALALHAIFRRRRRLLVDNAAFSMHLVSFVLISSAALLPGLWLMARGADPIAVAVFLAVFVWQSAYMAIAIRRFYLPLESRWPWLRAIVSALFIYFLNAAFITAVQIVGGAIALRSL
jgi:Protein of unknown function (DUF3667)